MGDRISEAQKSLVRLMQVFSPRAINRNRARHKGLESDFNRCLRAGLIQAGEHECSVAGDDFLNSQAGRTLLQEGQRE